MSSAVDLAVFSMKRVSLGAMRSNTTLRILDFPPLQVGMSVSAANWGVLMRVD